MTRVRKAVEKALLNTISASLEFIGDDPEREGLKNTPRRVINSWKELYSGYDKDPKKVMTIFSSPCNEMIILKDIQFFSTCEHHILPFFGKAHVGYIPSGWIVGVSKIVRVVEIFSRRLQIQERLTSEIADCLMAQLKPEGVMVVLEAQHLCMMARGVRNPTATMRTNAIRGVFKKLDTKTEFLEAISGR